MSGAEFADDAAWVEALAHEPLEHFLLVLYVAGTTPRSARAIVNVREICEQYLRGRYSLRIIDITRQATVATREQIVAVPLLIREQPLPARRFIGDMSDRTRIITGLEI